jgi:phosphohistidine phosphatase SixA
VKTALRPAAWAAGALWAAGLLGGPAHAEPSLVIVVRHAEKAPGAGGDPGLSAAGHQRAQALAERLAASGLSGIVTTQYLRTQETAQPAAKRFGLQAQVVAVRRGEGAAHVPEVLAAIRRLNGVVLVVGHSNTVADIVAGLAAARPLPLCETSHSHLFVIAPQPTAPALLQFNYGAADPPAQTGCQ